LRRSASPFVKSQRGILPADPVSDNLRIVRSVVSGDPWAALADPTRRAVLARVAERPSSVEQISETLPVSRPAVSQHLRVLAEANLVVARREGRCRIYRLQPEGLRAPRAELERFWSQALENFKQIAEEAYR
jgi:DNA-binding transcriptional ArsR family regulator